MSRMSSRSAALLLALWLTVSILGAASAASAVDAGPGDAPGWCFRTNSQGDLPTCTFVDGQWHRSYDSDGLGADGSGIPGAFVFLFVLVLIAGVAITVWQVTAARRMARASGMNEGDATAMTLLTDDGFEATYLAANLRGQTGPGTPAPATAASTADRLKQLGELRDQGLITSEEYDARRTAIIDSV